MEFIGFQEAEPLLRESGIAVTQDHGAERVRYELGGAHRACVVVSSNGVGPPVAGEQRVDVGREGFGAALERIVQRVHPVELAMIPAGTWQDILDAAAFDLAQDEMWLEIDAEAAFHQKNRDPLLMLQKNRHLIRTLADAIVANAAKEEQGFVLAALGMPFLVEVSHEGSARVWCADPGVAEGVVRAAQGR